MNQPTKPCGRTVYWWNGEYEGECERPDGHNGDHYDGLSWYDNDMNCTDDEHTEPPADRLGA